MLMRTVFCALALLWTLLPASAWWRGSSGPPNVAISGISSGTPGYTTATITYTTAPAAVGQVCYGTTTAYGTCSPLEGSPTTSPHTTNLSGLASNALYHYQITATITGLLPGVSPDETFTTATFVASCSGDPSHATDGCDGAYANGTPNFIQAGFLTYAAQSGQTLQYYPCDVTAEQTCWFLAGANDLTTNPSYPQGGYPVGYYTPKASLADPSTAAHGTSPGQLPTTCTYYPAGHAWYNGFGPMVDCNGSVSPTISGFDFGPTANHDCIQLTFEANVTGTITVTNSNFEAGGTTYTCASAGAVVGVAPTIIGLIYFKSVNQATATNVTLTFDSFNGHWLDPCCNQIFEATVGRAVGLAPFYILADGGNIGLTTLDYSNIIGFNASGPAVGHITNGSTTANPGGYIMGHSYTEGIQARSPYGHTDMIYFAASQNSSWYEQHYETYYNTVLQTGSTMSLGTGWQFHNTGGALGYTTSYIQDHNFEALGNLITGASTVFVTGGAGGTIDDGSGSAGSIFTLTSGGPVFTGSCTAAGDFCLTNQINSTQWHIDCSSTAPTTYCSGTNKGRFYPNVSILATVPPATPFSNHWANFASAQHAHGIITNVAVTNNYIDSYIDLTNGGSPFSFGGGGTVTNHPMTFTNNFDMRTGATLPCAGSDCP